MFEMPKARKNQIPLDATSYYHVVTRCVPRSFLCGKGSHGNKFEHRKQWIEDKLILNNSLARYLKLNNSHITLGTNECKV